MFIFIYSVSIKIIFVNSQIISVPLLLKYFSKKKEKIVLHGAHNNENGVKGNAWEITKSDMRQALDSFNLVTLTDLQVPTLSDLIEGSVTNLLWGSRGTSWFCFQNPHWILRWLLDIDLKNIMKAIAHWLKSQEIMEMVFKTWNCSDSES
jgi:hypothetical protein